MSYINWRFIGYVSTIALACCLPLWLIKVIKKFVDPSKEDKIK